MTLTLENFEQQIDPTILERGRRYARDGRVLTVEKEADGTWTARVEGTNLYEVTIEQTPTGDLSCLCTCPYDWGPTCKHIAAVLYTIEGVRSHHKPSLSLQKGRDASRKRAPTSEQPDKKRTGGLACRVWGMGHTNREPDPRPLPG